MLNPNSAFVMLFYDVTIIAVVAAVQSTTDWVTAESSQK